MTLHDHPFTFMHILNLDTIGGVETLYMHFLQHVWKKEASLHVTSISGKKAHPLYQEKMKELRYTPFYERVLFGCSLPKWLRFVSEMRRWMLTDISKASLLIFWNRIEQAKSPLPFLYYEHGASWNISQTPQYKQFFESCQGAICVSEAAKYMLEQKISPTFPIQILPNPLRPDITIAQQPKTVSNQPLRLGFVGRLLPIKAPAIALFTLHELMQKHAIDAKLTLVGSGKEKSFLLDQAKALNIQSKVQFLDNVQHLERFYDETDILLVPSIREPLGLVALEASARGVPIVATCVDGLAESVQQGVSGLLIQPEVPTNDTTYLSSQEGLPEVVFDPIHKALGQPKIPSPIAFAQAIVEIIQTKGLYERLSRGGIEQARAHAQFDSWCSSLLSIFRSHISIREED